ncbi:MAG TPA: KEOPS complex subunit Pcc1 [Methanocorpusculum sp.]|nr:KEOPS complex subunit Pcc1 [Methanocorpusculum sp.]
MTDGAGVLGEEVCGPTHTAEFRFACPYADKLYAVLAPEAGSDPGEKSRVHISCDGEIVTLFVEAGDAAALRASLNMWLRLANVCNEVLEL